MKTRLFMLTEHSPFMMGFVFLPQNNRAVIIDGGRPEDMPWLLELAGDREIAAWILTHPHYDHISGFNAVIQDAAGLDGGNTLMKRVPSLVRNSNYEL